MTATRGIEPTIRESMFIVYLFNDFSPAPHGAGVVDGGSTPPRLKHDQAVLLKTHDQVIGLVVPELILEQRS